VELSGYAVAVGFNVEDASVDPPTEALLAGGNDGPAY
jgi:hypothetical protein